MPSPMSQNEPSAPSLSPSLSPVQPTTPPFPPALAAQKNQFRLRRLLKAEPRPLDTDQDTSDANLPATPDANLLATPDLEPDLSTQVSIVQFTEDGVHSRRAFEPMSVSIVDGGSPFDKELLLVNSRGRVHNLRLVRQTSAWLVALNPSHPSDVQPSFAANSVCIRSLESTIGMVVAHRTPEDQRGFLERLCAAGCVMRDFVDQFTLMPADDQPPGEILIASPCSSRTTAEVVALKKASDHRMKQLHHEVKVLLGLQHDAIIRAHGIYEVKVKGNRSLAMVIDYKGGGDLLSWIPQDGGLPENQVRQMMTPICDALVYLHGIRVVHKDIKPSNMLCDRAADGSIKVVLADFEYAAYIPDKEMLSQRCGSCGFVAPEMLRNDWMQQAEWGTDRTITKIDVFSFGMTIYGAIFGRNPFEDETEKLTFLRNARCLISFADMRGRSEELRTLLEGLCAKNPEARYTSSEAFAHPWFARGRWSDDL
jgi:serine/threonine protein kinase